LIEEPLHEIHLDTERWDGVGINILSAVEITY